MFEFDMFSMSNRSFIACTMYTHTRSRWVINGLLYIRLNTSDNSVWQTRIIWTSNFWYFPVFFYSTMPSWLFLFIVYCRMHGIGCFICLFVCKKKLCTRHWFYYFPIKRLAEWVTRQVQRPKFVKEKWADTQAAISHEFLINFGIFRLLLSSSLTLLHRNVRLTLFTTANRISFTNTVAQT